MYFWCKIRYKKDTKNHKKKFLAISKFFMQRYQQQHEQTKNKKELYWDWSWIWSVNLYGL